MDSGYLSAHLKHAVAEWDRWREEDGLLEGESELIRKVIRFIARSLEGFASKASMDLVDNWKDDPDSWKYEVDEFYSQEAVEAVPGVVRRFLKLPPVLEGIIPSEQVRLYLREATRCYLYGFFEACIALSRTALEAGLNDYLKRRLGKVPSQKLVEKLKSANKWKLLTSESAGMAEDVAKAAGMVLHQRPAKSEHLAFDTLTRARGVLRELYES